MTKDVKHKKLTTFTLPKTLVILGLVIAVIAILLLKQQPQVDASQNAAVVGVATASGSPAEQYKYAIANSKPTLVFFHSNTCDSCIQMIRVVNEVFPEFAGQVTLVDVNVYDQQNQGLISRVGISYIPTQVFYDHTGESQVVVGIMNSQDLRQKLSEISQEPEE
ncbi:MAG: thioredoxin family protein [Anaerolineales bacterium]|nr:thioredoxin family protein [Anaerolineales bacterium]